MSSFSFRTVGIDRAVTRVGEALLTLGGPQVVEERLRGLRVLGVRGDRAGRLDQDRLIGRHVVDVLAGGLGAERLALVGRAARRPCRT